MNPSPDLDGCHTQFGHACNSRLTMDAWNDLQTDGGHFFELQCVRKAIISVRDNATRRRGFRCAVLAE